MQSVDGMRQAVIDRKTRIVLNVIEAPADWVVDDGLRLVPSETAGPDDTYNTRTGAFTPVTPPPAEKTLHERYAKAGTQAEKLAVIAKHLNLEV